MFIINVNHGNKKQEVVATHGQHATLAQYHTCARAILYTRLYIDSIV